MANQLSTRRAWGVVENRFQIGRASSQMVGPNQGCAIAVTAGNRPIMLTHVLAQVTNYQSTTLNFVRVLALNGDVPADVSALQGMEQTVGFYPPSTFGNSISGTLLWQQFAMMGNGPNNSTTPIPNVREDFTYGPVVQPGETLSVLAFPMINVGASDFTSLVWMQLCAWGRTLTESEAAAIAGGATGGNARALPNAMAGYGR